MELSGNLKVNIWRQKSNDGTQAVTLKTADGFCGGFNAPHTFGKETFPRFLKAKAVTFRKQSTF